MLYFILLGLLSVVIAKCGDPTEFDDYVDYNDMDDDYDYTHENDYVTYGTRKMVLSFAHRNAKNWL